MSISLLCPNCGREVGVADHKDNYVKHFHYFNEKKEPTCLTCGTGKSLPAGIQLVIVIIGLITSYILLL